MKKLFLVSVAALTTIVATMVASSACIWGLYQPVEPKCLREE
jgi:AgrD protein